MYVRTPHLFWAPYIFFAALVRFRFVARTGHHKHGVSTCCPCARERQTAPYLPPTRLMRVSPIGSLPTHAPRIWTQYSNFALNHHSALPLNPLSLCSWAIIGAIGGVWRK